jgi:HSP20 family molecular chaperone IbpA
MTSLMQRPSLIPEVFRFLEGGLPFGDHHAVRIEDYRDNGTYVLRAELPGVDPDRDVRITVDGNQLSITAERKVEQHDKSHSEFFYGSFSRTVQLPSGADTSKIKASYDAGILQVSVPVTEQARARQIRVSVKK